MYYARWTLPVTHATQRISSAYGVHYGGRVGHMPLLGIKYTYILDSGTNY